MIMCKFWDSQTTTSDFKSTHRPCGRLLVKSLGSSFLKTSYQCLMCYLTHVLQNMEGETWTQDVHVLWPFSVEVTPGNAKVTHGSYFWSKFDWKWNFYEVTCHHHQPSQRRLETQWLCFICWGWPKIEFQSIFDGENDDFGKCQFPLQL